MKLLVIVLCLLSERFLTHTIAKNRFDWFSPYFAQIKTKLPQNALFANPVLLLALVIFPVLFITWLILVFFDNLLFGFFALVLNLIIFHYCLGPENPFYPTREKVDESHSEEEIRHYFFRACGQLFSPVFWYILAGPIAVLAYRLINLCQKEEVVREFSYKLTSVLDWLPARIATFLYLLVGNFQQGINFYLKQFLSSPSNNEYLLGEGGLKAANTHGVQLQMPYAESLVEHAITVFLVFLALFTLVAWL